VTKPQGEELSKGCGQLEVTVAEDGRISLTALCLKTDSWEDYQAFKLLAREAGDRGDVKACRRYLRAALMCLFSHFEGVVNEITANKSIVVIGNSKSLSARAQAIGLEAGRRTRVPFVNFRLGKYLRDLVAHPGIEKAFRERGTTRTLNGCSVYEDLTMKTIQDLEGTVAPWIEAVCSAFGVERFPGQQSVDEFADALKELAPDATVDSRSRTQRDVDLQVIKRVSSATAEDEE